MSVSADVAQFTQEKAGVIKGSTEDGTVFAEPDGTGSVNGWDTVKSHIANSESEIAHINSEMVVVNQAVASNTTAIGQNTTAIQTNADAIQANATAIGEVSAKVDDLETSVGEDVTALGDRVTAVETSVAGAVSDVSALSGRVDDVEASVASVAPGRWKRVTSSLYAIPHGTLVMLLLGVSVIASGITWSTKPTSLTTLADLKENVPLIFRKGETGVYHVINGMTTEAMTGLRIDVSNTGISITAEACNGGGYYLKDTKFSTLAWGQIRPGSGGVTDVYTMT